MKAVVYQSDRGLVYTEVPEPRIEPDQVLVRVSDTGFCGSDHSMIEGGGLPDGFILGHETSGEVMEVGSDVDGGWAGTKVIMRPTFCSACPDCRAGRPYFCQQGRRTMGIGDLPGGFAEYTAVYPGMLIPVPSGVDSENAALAEAFAASLHGIECSRAEGGSALVIGGGAIGLALVRLLKLRGFFPICLSEPVESKRRLGLEWGADRAVDPLADHVGAVGFELTGGRMFETVFECSGAEGQVDAAMNLAARGGVVCVVSVMARPVEINPLVLNFKEIWVTGSYSNTHEENREVMDWMAQGRLDGRPLITDRIGLAELPRVYQERIHTGRALKVMVRIGPGF